MAHCVETAAAATTRSSVALSQTCFVSTHLFSTQLPVSYFFLAHLC